MVLYRMQREGGMELRKIRSEAEEMTRSYSVASLSLVLSTRMIGCKMCGLGNNSESSNSVEQITTSQGKVDMLTYFFV